MNHHVKGIGGIFFRSKEPKLLAAWYTEHFGINDAQSETMWQTEGGITVFSPFKHDSDYFPAQQPCMVNFRVHDLDGFLSKLSAAGVSVDAQRMDEPYGKFAWVYDPEGNKIELWEPA
jgi:predicted enzyme related to lactoylglutathione lyase